MRLVAYTEIAIVARVILGTIFLQNSFLTPIFYLHFVRMRYFQSAFTKEAFNHTIAVIEGYITKPEAPLKAAEPVWNMLKAGVSRWMGLPGGAAPPPAPRR